MAGNQSKKSMWCEATAQALIGLVTSILLHKYIVMPATVAYVDSGGGFMDMSVAVWTTIFYTIISWLRTFSIRAFWNKYF